MRTGVRCIRGPYRASTGGIDLIQKHTRINDCTYESVGENISYNLWSSYITSAFIAPRSFIVLSRQRLRRRARPASQAPTNVARAARGASSLRRSKESSPGRDRAAEGRRRGSSVRVAMPGAPVRRVLAPSSKARSPVRRAE